MTETTTTTKTYFFCNRYNKDFYIDIVETDRKYMAFLFIGGSTEKKLILLDYKTVDKEKFLQFATVYASPIIPQILYNN